MTTSSFIFDQQYAELIHPMSPTLFGHYWGWVKLWNGEIVKALSYVRFSAGSFLAIEKTLNQDFWLVRIDRSKDINGYNDDDWECSQGVLF